MGSPRACLARGYFHVLGDIPGIFTFRFDPFIVSFLMPRFNLKSVMLKLLTLRLKTLRLRHVSTLDPRVL